MATEPKWGRVWRYQGKRGTTWRIRYTDASGRRVLETLGREPSWTQKRAEQELRRRLVDIERDGYTHPQRLTLHAFSERWLAEYLPGRNLKQTTTDNYQQPSTATSSPASATTPSNDSNANPNSSTTTSPPRHAKGYRPRRSPTTSSSSR